MGNFPTFNVHDFDKFFVGYDKMFDQIAEFHDTMAKNIPNYPPYNIKKTDDNKYVIELAVAGFGQSDIEIEVEDDKLKIKGNASQSESDNNTLYQGLAFRPFTRLFTLNDQVEVQNAEMINGLLKIYLERIIPESKKPKKIDIKSSGEKQYLAEGK
jgi:Molecular chaperone (small heat shock protein)